MLGAAVRTREQRILSVERDRADRSFNGVVVELDTAVIEEARQVCVPKTSSELRVDDVTGSPKLAE